MAAILPIRVVSNRPGEPVRILIDLEGLDEISFEVNVSRNGAVSSLSFSEDGLHISTSEIIMSGTDNVSVLGNNVSMAGKSVELAAGKVHMHGDDVSVTSDGALSLSSYKSILGYAKSFVVNVIEKLYFFGRNIEIRSSVQTLITSPRTRFSGEVIVGSAARPVARIGDKVLVRTANGPAEGEIISGSPLMRA